MRTQVEIPIFLWVLVSCHGTSSWQWVNSNLWQQDIIKFTLFVLRARFQSPNFCIFSYPFLHNFLTYDTDYLTIHRSIKCFYDINLISEKWILILWETGWDAASVLGIFLFFWSVNGKIWYKGVMLGYIILAISDKTEILIRKTSLLTMVEGQ